MSPREIIELLRRANAVYPNPVRAVGNIGHVRFCQSGSEWRVWTSSHQWFLVLEQEGDGARLVNHEGSDYNDDLIWLKMKL